MKLGIFGMQGSGKTLLSMILARMVQKVDSSTHIYTNIHAANSDNLFTINDLSEFPFNRERPKILILDEAMFSIDSRSSSSNLNQLWSRALAYFRKSNVVLTIYATHRPSMLDSRFREQLDMVIMCRKNKERFEYLMIDMVTQIKKPFYMPKHKAVYDFANYDTYDFPLPIEVIGLMNDPRFELKKMERTKVQNTKNVKASVS